MYRNRGIRRRRTHTCPQCNHKFKNFRWSRSWKYDVVAAAACPRCNTFAYEWPKIYQKKTGER